MNAPTPIPFDPTSTWPEPNFDRIASEAPPPPDLVLTELFTPKAAEWVSRTAEGAGAPADYVAATLITAAGAAMGNARWVSPWGGWYLPPLIWTMCVGNPSAGKSPAIDAVLKALKSVEKPLRQQAEADYKAWELSSESASMSKIVWEGRVKKALGKGEAPPPKPDDAVEPQEPHIPRLIVHDGTVERLGVIAEAQPKGFLQFRDELSGWLRIMEARNGGSDRAFWLEAYGGSSFSVERMGRRPLSVERLSIAVCGGIQPQPLDDLLMKTPDDGLLARFAPVYPHPAPIKRPTKMADDTLAREAFSKLVGLEMYVDESGEQRPWFCGFDSFAADAMDEWRIQCREWETDAEGLMLSFIGKLSGMAARLALVLSAIGYAFDGEPEPGTTQIGADKFGDACHMIESYFLPMARRAYASGSVSTKDKAARHLLHGVQSNCWRTFTHRDILRMGWRNLKTEAQLKPALDVLSEADLIRSTQTPPGPRGGRPTVTFEVNPRVYEAQS